MDLLKNKIAIITGGAKGIGLASAKAFVDEGAKVAITDVDTDNGEKAVSSLGQNAIFMKQDVSKEEDWKNVFKQVIDKFGKVDVVMNNAGIGTAVDIEHMSLDQWHRDLSVDLDGVFLGTKYGIINMKDHGGSIINLSSIEGLIGDPSIPAYNAAKGGVRLMTKSAALYCAKNNYGIRVNTIHPGYIDTPMVQAATKDNPEMEKYLISLHPMGRLGRAEEIANMAVFLASDKSSFSTGSEFVADGGYTAQ